MTLSPKKKIYLTDLEQNLTFEGFLKSYKEANDNIIATLYDIEVYDYTSSTPLFSLAETTLTKSKSKIYIENVACLSAEALC
ncbi:hypothetical protein [Mucilaginibacter kameinonensis]|uniref:hypothetical protein n=1 Tax=Mucilaginibacter kameinonensis TaxID=452286 RepID=UPI000EF7B7BB|nr:hypothetical protein [Mucilaginibacter kameinonensis]